MVRCTESDLAWRKNTPQLRAREELSKHHSDEKALWVYWTELSKFLPLGSHGGGCTSDIIILCPLFCWGKVLRSNSVRLDMICTCMLLSDVLSGSPNVNFKLKQKNELGKSGNAWKHPGKCASKRLLMGADLMHLAANLIATWSTLDNSLRDALEANGASFDRFNIAHSELWALGLYASLQHFLVADLRGDARFAQLTNGGGFAVAAICAGLDGSEWTKSFMFNMLAEEALRKGDYVTCKELAIKCSQIGSVSFKLRADHFAQIPVGMFYNSSNALLRALDAMDIDGFKSVSKFFKTVKADPSLKAAETFLERWPGTDTLDF